MRSDGSGDKKPGPSTKSKADAEDASLSLDGSSKDGTASLAKVCFYPLTSSTLSLGFAASRESGLLSVISVLHVSPVVSLIVAFVFRSQPALITTFDEAGALFALANRFQVSQLGLFVRFED